MIKIKKAVNSEFIKFLLTGALNTAFGYGIFSLFFWIFNNKAAALTLNYVIGIIFNFKTYSMLVFKSKDNSRIFIFIIIYVIAFFINYLSLYLFCDMLKINTYIAQLMALLYVPLLFYIMLKNLVFKNK